MNTKVSIFYFNEEDSQNMKLKFVILEQEKKLYSVGNPIKKLVLKRQN